MCFMVAATVIGDALSTVFRRKIPAVCWVSIVAMFMTSPLCPANRCNEREERLSRCGHTDADLRRPVHRQGHSGVSPARLAHCAEAGAGVRSVCARTWKPCRCGKPIPLRIARPWMVRCMRADTTAIRRRCPVPRTACRIRPRRESRAARSTDWHRGCPRDSRPPGRVRSAIRAGRFRPRCGQNPPW